MTRPYQFKCDTCEKNVHVMDSSGLSDEDNKIFEERTMICHKNHKQG